MLIVTAKGWEIHASCLLSKQRTMSERETDMQRKIISKALGAAQDTVGTKEHSHFLPKPSEERKEGMKGEVKCFL